MFSYFRSASCSTRYSSVVFSACSAIFMGLTWCHSVKAQNDWNGSISSDFYDGSNWNSGAPSVGGAIRIGQVSYTNAPVFSGSGDSPGNITVNGDFAGAFTMASGTFATSAGYLRVGDTNSGTATFTMNGGNVTVNGDFVTSYVSGAKSNFNMTAGTFEVIGTTSDQQVNFCRSGLGSNSPGTVSNVLMTGGTFTSNGRIRLGRSNSDSTTAQNPQALVTFTGGLMWAKGVNNLGTINFQGGKIDFSGGVLKGGDISSASGFNRNVANGNSGGINFTGGVLQIDTNLDEGTIYVIPQGVDPLTVVGTPAQRGQSRMLGALSFSDTVGSTTARSYSTLTSVVPSGTYTYVNRIWMTSVDGVRQANGFASNPGDFNLDGVVNQADADFWATQLGNTYAGDNLNVNSTLLRNYGADGNGDGVVTQADYDVWDANYRQRNTGGIYAWAKPVTIDVSSGSQDQTVAGYSNLSFTTAGSVEKTGGGTLVFDQANTMTGTVTISGGMARLTTANTLYSATLRPTMGGTVSLSAGLQTTVDGLKPTDGGLIDVGNGSVTISRGGVSLVQLQAALVVGRKDGGWDGATGITSSTSAAQVAAFEQRAVGWMSNDDGSVTVAYAAPGDTNLDWVVDVLDATNFVSSGKFGTGAAATWAEGDFNYDGVVDVLDAADFATSGLYNAPSYNAVTASGAPLAAVPEPSACVGVGIAGLVFARRLRRMAG